MTQAQAAKAAEPMPNQASTNGQPLPTTSLARFSAQSGAIVAFEPQRERVVADVDEIFRSIYTRAMVTGSEVLAICSAIAGEGRTTVAMGLALSLAQDFPDRQVLLVETDMQRPAIAKDFAIEATPGLLDSLTSGDPIETCYRETFLPNFQVLPVGGPVNNPSRLLRSNRMAATVDVMRQTHDLVILDLPPLLVTSDAVLMSDLADGVVWVVRAGATPAALVNRALEELDQVKLRGIVINGSQSAVPNWLRRLCGL
jgi:capsular exopolysaccharide synthesis family protein